MLIFNALANQSYTIIVCHKKQNKKIKCQRWKISMKLFTSSLIEKKMKYPPFIRDKCLADHKSGFQPLYRSAKHLCLSALFIAPRNKNSLIFPHKTSSVFLEKKVRSSKSDRSACEPHRHKLAPARHRSRSKVTLCRLLK